MIFLTQKSFDFNHDLNQWLKSARFKSANPANYLSIWSSAFGPLPDNLPSKQPFWDCPGVLAARAMVEAALTMPLQRAFYLAASSPHSSDWLLALPIASCGLRLDDEAVTDHCAGAWWWCARQLASTCRLQICPPGLWLRWLPFMQGFQIPGTGSSIYLPGRCPRVSWLNGQWHLRLSGRSRVENHQSLRWWQRDFFFLFQHISVLFRFNFVLLFDSSELGERLEL